MLNIHGVKKSFGGVQALKGCTLHVGKATITGLIGPNGAGKTTLFNVISGIFKPDEGEIRFKDERIDGLASHLISRKGILRTFQIPRGLNRMTVLENLLLYPRDQRKDSGPTSSNTARFAERKEKSESGHSKSLSLSIFTI